MSIISNKLYPLMFGRESVISEDLPFPFRRVYTRLTSSFQDLLSEQLANQAELQTYTWKPLTLVTRDGVRLVAREHRQRNSDKTIIMLHGHGNTGIRNDYDVARSFTEHNYNVVLLDNRGCESSGGNEITFGLLEQDDLTAWIDYLIFLHPEDQFAIYGCEMGASIACTICDRVLPSSVKALVLHSPFARIQDYLIRYVRYVFRLPGRLITPLLLHLFKKKTGRYITADTPLNHVGAAHLPALFILRHTHPFISFASMQKLYQLYGSEKETHILDEETDTAGFSASDAFLSRHFS